MRHIPASRPRVSISFWTIALFLGAAVASTSLFMITQKVQLREQRIAALNQTLLDEQQKTRILDAEWAYLSRPQRLEALVDARTQATSGIMPAGGESDYNTSHKMYLASTSAMPPAPTPIATIVEPTMDDGFDTPPPEDELKKVPAQTLDTKAAPAKAEAGSDVDTTSPVLVDSGASATAPVPDAPVTDATTTTDPTKTGIDDVPAVTDTPAAADTVATPAVKTDMPASEVKKEETAEKPKAEAAPKEKETPKAKPKPKPKSKPAPKKVDKNDEAFPIARLNKKASAPTIPKPQPLSTPRHGGVARPIVE